MRFFIVKDEISIIFEFLIFLNDYQLCTEMFVLKFILCL